MLRNIPRALLLLLVVAALPVFGQKESPQKDAAQGFIGSDACKTCHADVWSKFYKNPHFKSVASGKETPEHTGCESCHGPAAKHVEAHGGKATIVAFSQLEPKQILDNCLRCHAETLSRANIRRSLHTENNVVCTSCHSIHKSPVPKFLLANKQAELCYGCHADVRSQFSMPFKHRVNEGVMVCTDCHNPHGAFPPTWRMAERPHMMEQTLVNEEPCLKCHEEKRGPFVFEHPPVRVEGCEACHYPHGSANSRLLRRPVVFTMCLECHNGAPGFGRAGLGAPTPFSFHDLRSARYQNCTNCHSHIHGSNVDAFFLK
ncbi:MAG: DmsE family decaheme c-type cytochrome [Acidobacteriia bacterium]|nr:DmsE family decaheme c-type cytochrome [Terriglobia bacterium]